MDNKRLHAIAQATNTSKATVSKVLNHCYGVSGPVRDCVLREAGAFAENGGEPDRAGVYVVLPENPGYFWGCDLAQPADGSYKIKYNIYSRMGDHDTVRHYLDEAARLSARAILLATPLDEENAARVTALAEDRLVLFLTEYNDAVNTFYVGSDAAADAARLAEACLADCAGGRVLVLQERVPYVSKTHDMRLAAVADALRGAVDYDVVEVAMTAQAPSLSSMLARELNGLFQKQAYRAVVCLGGYTAAVCTAVQKMKLPQAVSCYGFENAPQNQRHAGTGYLKAAMCQNFSAQMAAALQAADDFVRTNVCPPQKFLYIPSELICY